MPAPTRIPTPHSYSSAVAAGGFVFLALHRGRGADFGEQLAATFEGLRKTLARFDLGLDALVKVNVWLRDIEDLPEMEQAFTRTFPKDGFPARMTATTEFIDGDCLVMIDGTACAGG
jgi:2-iminobutanoate/2-iminopropanoate deaminase